MRFLRQAKNIEILGKKSRFVRNVQFQLVVGQVTSKIDETTRMMKILGKYIFLEYGREFVLRIFIFK